MFRKLISNLPFSPSLVGQLGFYAKRLRKEEMTRRAGLIFTALALVVQSLVVFQPPESANAASSSDMVYGGLGYGQNASIDNFLSPYDKNTNNLKDIMTHMGITRAEISSAKYGSWKVGSNYTWGLKSRATYAQGERAVSIVNSSGKTVRTVYAKPQSLVYKRGSASTATGWIGHSAKLGWFAIDQACGNLVTTHIPNPPPVEKTPVTPGPSAACTLLSIATLSRTSVELQATVSAANGAKINSYTFTVTDSTGKSVHAKKINSSAKSYKETVALTEPGKYTAKVTVGTSIGNKTGTACTKSFTIAPPDKCPVHPGLSIEDKECQPCPGDNNIWVKDEECAAQIVKNKTSINIDTDVDATTNAVEASQRLLFTISAKNEGKLAADVDLTDNIEDLLEYAQLSDRGGSTFNKKARTLSWGTVTLQPGESVSKTFVAKALDKIPEMAKGRSESASYDCTIVNTFGNSTTIDVDCPTAKVIETVASEMPTTGPRENMLFAGVVLTIVTYFYARSRQLKKEVRLVRRELTTGAI